MDLAAEREAEKANRCLSAPGGTASTRCRPIVAPAEAAARGLVASLATVRTPRARVGKHGWRSGH
jgi:hypothetical protein